MPDARSPESYTVPEEFGVARQNTSTAAARSAGGHELPAMNVGDRVHYKNAISKSWSVGGVIRRVRESGRSYDVETPAGVFPRNRRFLRLDTSPTIDIEEPVPEIEIEDMEPRRPRRSRRLAAARVHFANEIFLIRD